MQLHRPTTAQLCIHNPLHPAAVGIPLPAANPCSTNSTLLSSHPLVLFSAALFSSLSPLSSYLAPLTARTSRNQRIDGVTGDAARRACERDPQN